MSTNSSANMINNMSVNGFDWSKATQAPQWNNWTDNAKTALSYAPGQYQSAPEYKWASWESAPTRNAYSGSDPTFQRLSNGDYTRLETSLRTPGEIAAKNALKTGQIGLNGAMTANGMYGSSIMANQANDQLYRNYLDTMATNSANAVGKRYGMEQSDNQFAGNFDQNVWNTKVAQNTQLNQMNLQEALAKNNAVFGQNQNYNAYNLANTQGQNNYNMNSANWALGATNQYNQLQQQPYEDQWRRATFDASQSNDLWNRYFNFWQNNDPLKDQQVMQQNASMAAQRDSGGGMLSALGGIGGSMTGAMAGSMGKSFGGGIADWAKGLLSAAPAAAGG